MSSSGQGFWGPVTTFLQVMQKQISFCCYHRIGQPWSPVAEQKISISQVVEVPRTSQLIQNDSDSILNLGGHHDLWQFI